MARDGRYSDIKATRSTRLSNKGSRDRSSTKCEADQFPTARSCGATHPMEPFAELNAPWRNCLKREEALKGEAEVPQYVKDSLRAKVIEEAHKQEVDAPAAAYAQAVELPGYKHGDFTNVWC